jgi:hypothetical protein
MAKIYSNNKEFNGISASVNFVNGVGVTDDPYLISWFKEHGYTVEIEIKPEDIENMTYKELTDYAKERGFNGIGYKKPELIKALLEKEFGIVQDNKTGGEKENIALEIDKQSNAETEE